MAIPVKVTWQDTNAPQLTEAARSLLAVLDFALLNNGWSKDFTDTDVAVYRAPLGNRKYYRIHDNNGYGYNGLYSAKVTGYDSMTDANTGAGWGSVSYIRKARSSGNKRWLVFVDAYGFMIITQPAGDTTTNVNTYPFIPNYLGDDVVIMPGNTPRAVICAASDTSSDSYGGGSGMCVPTYAETGSFTARSFANRSLSGSTSPSLCYTMGIRTTWRTNNTMDPSGCVASPYSYPYNGSLLYCDAILTDTSATYTIGSRIPWFYHSICRGSTLTSLQEYTDNTKTFIALRTCGSGIYGYAPFDGNSLDYGAVLICTNESR